jgi:cation transport ATPase
MVNEEEELKTELEKLYDEKKDLELQIRELDKEKIEKLTKEKEELEKQVEKLDKDKKRTEKEKENFLRQVKNSRRKKWLNSFKMIALIGAIDLIIIPLIIFFLKIPIQWIFIGIGLVTFFGILLTANYMSGTSPFNTGEIRKAITGSFIAVYFTFLPAVTFGGSIIPSGEPVKTIISNFTWIVGLIIVFYFGSRTVEEYVKSRK